MRQVSGDAQPVMCGYPASYDWTFLYGYLIRFTGESPFGHSGCLDMKTLYATKAGVLEAWNDHASRERSGGGQSFTPGSPPCDRVSAHK